MGTIKTDEIDISAIPLAGTIGGDEQLLVIEESRIKVKQLNQSGIITATTDAVTGGKSLSFSGVAVGMPSVTGRAYTTINLPLNQSGGASVLPTDYSDNGYASTFGASNITPWNWPGVVTISPDSSGSNVVTDSDAINVSLFADSFIAAFTPIAPVTGSGYQICGFSNATAAGVNSLIGTTGLLGPRLYCAAGVAFASMYGVATVGGGFVGAKTNTAGYAIGVGTVTLGSAGKGAVTIGDVVRFGTDMQNYTISSGDADISGGGAISFAPNLQQAIPTAATEVTLVGGARVHRVMLAWDAPTQKIIQYVDGVVDFSRTSDKAVVAGDVSAYGFSLGQPPSNGASAISQFSGFQFLKFADSSLPMNIDELAVIDNTRRRMGLLDVPVFL